MPAVPYGRTWTPEREAQLIALHNRADLPTDRAVAVEMGLTQGSVYGRLCLLRHHGVIARRPPSGPKPPMSIDPLARLATGGWTVALLARLCAGWRAGETAGPLAARLGVTENALIGKVHRLVARGILEGRASPLGVNKGTGKPRERRAVPAPPAATLPASPPIQLPPPPLPPPPPPPPPPATSCRWPMWGDQERPTHEYCAAPVPLGASYCSLHHRIVFHRVRAA